MSDLLENYFQLKEHGTDVRTEVMAVIVTFMTVAYIIFFNPSILEAAGIPFGASIVATILAAVFGSLAGTTTTGTYIESATGIEEGGLNGLTAVVVAILFALGLFFYPLFSAIPMAATSPALIVGGLLMISSIKKTDMNDFTDMIPAMSAIILMSFTYNLGVGLCAGFVLFPILKETG